MRIKAFLTKLVVGAALAGVPAASFASIVVSVGIAPPPLPVYTQPICPGEGYLWTPGYWAYGDEGYFWVPGVWVNAPQPGFLWTPGYWGWGGSAFLWHGGYWGPHIGFYGGVNYGFGYIGHGYEGGYWNSGHFFYNRTVNNINVVNIHNTYNRTVVVNNNVTFNHVSYNGGNGGLQARPSVQEQSAVRDQHLQPTSNQLEHQTTASQDRTQFARVNGGHPQIAAQARVGDRTSVVASRGYNQQQRIGNGVRNGNLTAGEASRAENRQANIHQQVRTDRQANGGALTPAERQQVNREQSGASRQIIRETHNSNVQPQDRPQNRPEAPRGGGGEREHR